MEESSNFKQGSNRKWMAITAVIVVLLVSGLIAFLAFGGSGSENNPSSPQTSSNSSAQNSTNPESTKVDIYSKADVATHSTKSDCWTIINGNVYDLTSFISSHQGGDEVLRACGIDGTSLFTERETSSGQSVGSGTPHSSSAESQLKSLKIGTLANE